MNDAIVGRVPKAGTIRPELKKYLDKKAALPSNYAAPTDMMTFA